MPNDQVQLPHIFVSGTEHTYPYTSPSSGRGTERRPARNRDAHGRLLTMRLTDAIDQARAARQGAPDLGIPKNRITLLFRSEPGFELQLKSLESKSGIELLAVREVDRVFEAAVSIPDGQVGYFLRKIEAYLDPSRDSDRGKPKNQRLVESISDVRRATLRQFWTEEDEPFPEPDQVIRWEVWLRGGQEGEDHFRSFARQRRIPVSTATLALLDRRVLLAAASPAQLAESIDVLDSLAELRRAHETASDFLAFPSQEQAELIEDLRRRSVPPAPDAPAVCLLDTGVRRGHRLIEPFLPRPSWLSYDREWGPNDHEGHGTEMAGLALYGDLQSALLSAAPVDLSHGLESVKILPPTGQNPHELYGSITIAATALAEAAAPRRPRVYSLTVTSKKDRDRGRPSSWSSVLDDLASGATDGHRRLFCVSAGNVDRDDWPHYPHAGEADSVHDPAQAWNALTVGAYTERCTVADPMFAGWRVLAPPGELSPSSTTSLTWQRAWPFKPDIVLEGGNALVDPGGTKGDICDDVLLLTTDGRPGAMGSLTTTGQTSAAAAQAARLAAIVRARYPQLWPETVRGLVVHSARWTPAMASRFPERNGRVPQERLRCFGFGVPDLGTALWSASNALTLVAQSSLRPYELAGSTARTRDMHVHALPWPRDALLDLGDAPVELRVTLSYFVEPDASRRGHRGRYRYMSHGLRFDVNTPEESEQEFLLRLNKAARDEELGLTKTTTSDAARWELGPDARSGGSIHSDTWRGTAAELAQRGYVGVFPVIGWWRERPHLDRWNLAARYALVVSIRTADVTTDIYTPVANMVGVPTEVTT